MSMLIVVLLGLILLCPTLSLYLNLFNKREKSVSAARIGGNLIGSGFLASIGLLTVMATQKASIYFYHVNINTLSVLLSSLVLFVSFIVNRFSLRYMDGDRLYKRYFTLLAALTISAVFMVLSDNIFLFWFAWSLSNLLLITLIVHKKAWKAAKNSGKLIFYTLAPGSLSLLLAFSMLYISCATSSISDIVATSNIPYISIIVALVILSGLMQSAIWPFQRWLLSSLNSPTPVSAFMHAGLVNGGGILVVKFAPLIVTNPAAMNSLFLFGVLSAVLGTIWKLMQTDMKRMLACSTMAQMGFMMAQCGLGLFAAAIAHLCWHGLFKAYLFLSSGSALEQGQVDNNTAANNKVISFILSISGGVVTMLCFAYMANKDLFSLRPTTFVIFFACMAGTQLMYTMLQRKTNITQIVIGVLTAAFVGLVYGTSVHFVETLLPHVMVEEIPDLSIIHWTSLALLVTLWISFNLDLHKRFSQSNLGCWIYMQMFNASQPSANTVTALRKDYNF